MYYIYFEIYIDIYNIYIIESPISQCYILLSYSNIYHAFRNPFGCIFIFISSLDLHESQIRVGGSGN